MRASLLANAVDTQHLDQRYVPQNGCWKTTAGQAEIEPFSVGEPEREIRTRSRSTSTRARIVLEEHAHLRAASMREPSGPVKRSCC